MTSQQFRGMRQNVRETIKLGLRATLGRRNLDLVRDPFPGRVVRALHSLGIDTVIDVGANVGQFGSALRVGGYRGRIISCEPLPPAFGRLRSRARRDPNWKVVNRAMGAEPGTAVLHIAANSYSSSVLPMTPAHLAAAPDSNTVAAVEVPVSTIANLIREHRIVPERTLLKIDTQGYEAQVLDGAGELLPRLGAIQLELSFVTLYEGQELAGALCRRMDRAGFGLYAWDSSFNDPHSGRLLQADVVFAPRANPNACFPLADAAGADLDALATAAGR